jgi:hypothetical protein
MVKFSLWNDHDHDWSLIGIGAVGAIPVSLAVSIAARVVATGPAV